MYMYLKSGQSDVHWLTVSLASLSMNTNNLCTHIMAQAYTLYATHAVSVIRYHADTTAIEEAPG